MLLILIHNNTPYTLYTPLFTGAFEKGDRMREAVNINLGLLALKKCVEAINNNNKYVSIYV